MAMTEKQKAQFRAIFEFEGFTLQEIEATLRNIARSPREERGFIEFISKWKLPTAEIKH